jgi:hypothetical protein
MPQPHRVVSIFCPHCHKHTSLDPALVQAKDRHGDTVRASAVWLKGIDDTWWIGVCNGCQMPVLVQNRGETIYPPALPKPTDLRVPDDMRGDLDEAKQCFGVGAWRASSVMARRAMQSAAIEKGASKNKKLQDQIEELAGRGQITRDLAECAHAVRFVGNDGAHPGGEPVTQDDADAVLQLAEQLLHLLYVTPAIAGSMRKKRGK